ncbi:MAG TPA: hypothetical protein PLR88_07135 [Bacteroidales bacterium]|nr:hypothetical protein [Bacteroidales bacterium]HPT21704.1 hypothetical protein [Bacteroidales bacterium]
MKINHENSFSEISSFEDFRKEKERLDFKSNLIEARLKLAYLQITERLSISNLVTSIARETVLPKISGFLGDLIKKVGTDTKSEPDNKMEV